MYARGKKDTFAYRRELKWRTICLCLILIKNRCIVEIYDNEEWIFGFSSDKESLVNGILKIYNETMNLTNIEIKEE